MTFESSTTRQFFIMRPFFCVPWSQALTGKGEDLVNAGARSSCGLRERAALDEAAQRHQQIGLALMLHQAAGLGGPGGIQLAAQRSEEHTSELQTLMRISYAVFCLKKKHKTTQQPKHTSKATDNTN